jgi:hypothetical protein
MSMLSFIIIISMVFHAQTNKRKRKLTTTTSVDNDSTENVLCKLPTCERGKKERNSFGRV